MLGLYLQLLLETCTKNVACVPAGLVLPSTLQVPALITLQHRLSNWLTLLLQHEPAKPHARPQPALSLDQVLQPVKLAPVRSTKPLTLPEDFEFHTTRRLRDEEAAEVRQAGRSCLLWWCVAAQIEPHGCMSIC